MLEHGKVDRKSAGRALVCAGVAFASMLRVDVAEAADDPLCTSFFGGTKGWLRSDANRDLYNGVAWLLAGGIVSEAGQPTRRWSAVNDFDDQARDALRIDSIRGRRRADRASDAFIGVSMVGLPLASIAAHQWRTGDCEESWDMVTDYAESFGLALLASESLKLVSGRRRPFTQECGPDPPPDATCFGRDRNSSFVSGHATLVATGAGVTCAFSVKRRAWGESTMARAAPCGAGVGLALATGGLRVAADRHWLTDVLGGFAIGAAIGWFDTWGPFDLLRYEGPLDASGRPERFGFIVPGIVEGGPGLRAAFVF